jgi:hypothetical protein
MSTGEFPLSELLLGMRKRARAARLAAYIMVAVLVMIGATTGYYFLAWSSSEDIVVEESSVPPLTGRIEGRSERGGGVDWLSAITRAFVRIASVIMAVFVINILVSFARYNFRVANYLESRADCIFLTGGDVERIAILLPSISVDMLDFMKTPMNPYETYLGVLRAIFSRQRNGNAQESMPPEDRVEPSSPADEKPQVSQLRKS